MDIDYLNKELGKLAETKLSCYDFDEFFHFIYKRIKKKPMEEKKEALKGLNIKNLLNVIFIEIKSKY